MSEEERRQWHPSFYGAVDLVSVERRRNMHIVDELHLGRLPLRVDAVLIKRDKNYVFEKEIEQIYRTHNLMEFKSPDAKLNYNTFLKGMACVYLYKVRENQPDEIELSDISISFIRERKPIKLFKKLREENYVVEEKYPGIYHVDRGDPFGIQVVVTRELDADKYIWLSALSSNLSRQHIEKLIEATNNLVDEHDKKNADAVWELVASKNVKVLQEIKEDKIMCEALVKIMKPEMELVYSDGFGDGAQNKGIQVFKNMIKQGISKEDAQAMAEISDELMERALAEC